MKQAIAFLALAALTACGVDGVPERPSEDSALAPAKNVRSEGDGLDWINGTVSMHTAATL